MRVLGLASVGTGRFDYSIGSSRRPADLGRSRTDKMNQNRLWALCYGGVGVAKRHRKVLSEAGAEAVERQLLVRLGTRAGPLYSHTCVCPVERTAPILRLGAVVL